MGIRSHTFFVILFYFFPYFSNSLDIVKPVTNNDENNAIINVCSKFIPISNIDDATLPDMRGEKNDTPKLPSTRAKV